jgi:2-dehydro-3-deoxygalactonokinase
MIGLDWGITRLRAYAIGACGTVLDALDRPSGILSIEDEDFEAVFHREVGPMAADAPGVPILASGMITSRQGWVETPYVGCPAGAEALAAALVRHEAGAGRVACFAPGMRLDGPDGTPDVMRGEETQIVGALSAGGGGLMVLPGSHSKWTFADRDEVTWFATFMTGELYGLLREHSILGRLMAPQPVFEAAAFARGLDRARDEGPGAGGLLKRLFGVRTLGLFDCLAPEAAPDYLSGLLIGTEIGEALAAIDEPVERVTVIGGESLSERYAAALRHFGLRAEPAAPDLAARGLLAIARAAGLVTGP